MHVEGVGQNLGWRVASFRGEVTAFFNDFEELWHICLRDCWVRVCRAFIVASSRRGCDADGGDELKEQIPRFRDEFAFLTIGKSSTRVGVAYPYSGLLPSTFISLKLLSSPQLFAENFSRFVGSSELKCDSPIGDRFPASAPGDLFSWSQSELSFTKLLEV